MKSNKRNINKEAILFLFIGLLVLYAYGKLPLTFFQQDEWAGFRNVIYHQSTDSKGAKLELFFKGSSVHFTPFTNFIFQLQYRFFHLDFIPYIMASLILHLFNTLLVFYLASILFKRFDLSLIVGLLFAVNSSSHQAVSWVAASINTQGACLFTLLSLIFLAKQQFTFSILALALSLGFKETSIFLFIFLPISCLFLARKRKIFPLKKLLIPLFVFAFFYFSLRLFLLFNAPSLPVEQAKALTQPSKVVYLYRLVSLPLRTIPQSLISTRQIISWAERLVFLAYSHYFVAADGSANPYVVETIAFDLMSYFLALVILLFSYTLYCYFKQTKEKRLSKGLLFSLTLIISSAFPFIFIPGKAGFFSIFGPRNLYITGIGSSLLLSLGIFGFSGWLASKIKKTGKSKEEFLAYGLMFTLLMAVLFIHVRNIRKDIDKLVINSQLRKSILNQIEASYPDLPEKVIFYTKSDKAYYGLPADEKILPFQSGFGQTLLVWYQEKEKFPSCFFQDVFLYEITSQGYRGCQGRGFGYFRKYENLVKALGDNNLSAENIYAFSWDGKREKLTNITNKIRQKLEKDI